MKYLSECDLLVYDLHQGNPKDVELAIQALRKYNVEEEKVLILISSLMVWNKTPPKMREVDENGKFIEEKGSGDGTTGEGGGEESKAPEDKPPAEDAPEEDVTSSRAQTNRKEVEKPKRYVQVPYLEEDYKHRVPSEEYEELKALEDELLAFKKDNVKIYILASGIMYGAGESIFEQHFKRAWLQNPPALPYLGVGKNYVPTIHVKDLARMVKKIYETKPPIPEKQYIFATDNTRKPT